MKRIILFLITIAAILTLGACSNESLIDESEKDIQARTIKIEAFMPEEVPSTRVDLNLQPTDAIKLTWEVGDVLEFAFVQPGSTTVKNSYTVKAEDIKTAGKHIAFNIVIPSEIDKTANYSVCTVHNGAGLDISGANPIILLPTNTGDATSLASVKSRKDVVLYNKKGISPTDDYVQLQLKHLGSIISINLSNNSPQPWAVTQARLVGIGTPTNWAYNVGATANSYDFITGTFSDTGSAGNFISFKIDPATIAPEESTTLYVWTPFLTGVTLPDLVLQVTTTSSAILESNVKSKTVPGASVFGKNYVFDASWNGMELILEDGGMAM